MLRTLRLRLWLLLARLRHPRTRIEPCWSCERPTPLLNLRLVTLPARGRTVGLCRGCHVLHVSACAWREALRAAGWTVIDPSEMGGVGDV